MAWHNSPAIDCSFCEPDPNLRYLLAIAGLLAAVVVAIVLYMFIPHGQPPGAAVAQTNAGTTPTKPNSAENSASTSPENGDGSLRVCNQTANPVSVALGYKAPKGWQSEGWWVAKGGECVSVYNGRLDARYYYIFAADDVGGGVWDGTNYMCTRDESFTIFGVEDCLARGYERTGFFEVDTQNKPNWTLQLTDGEVVSGGTDAPDDSQPLEGDGTNQGADDPQPADDGGTE